MNDESRRIAYIEVIGLFDRFNHRIDLNLNEGITIVHGPNGVGKTTLLNAIYCLFQKKLPDLNRIPFKEIRIKFEGMRAQLKIIKQGKKLVFSHLDNQQTWPLRRDESGRYLPRHIVDRYVPHLRRIGPREWIDRLSDDVVDLDEIIIRYGHEFPKRYTDRLQANLKSWLLELLDSVRAHLIETQRLFVTSKSRYDEPMLEAVVLRYSKEMANLIQKFLRQSGVLGASLDRTFPHRLLQKSKQAKTEHEIRDWYKKQEAYRSRLMKAGLIEEESPLPLSKERLTKNDINVLTYYLRDVDRKFKQFDELLRRVELFKEIINSRFLFKSFHVDKDKGFIFSSDTDKSIESKDLSSGEQHELVLAFQLIFKFEPQSLILIDEPEISLHVTWQRKFLGDLSKIAKLNYLDFLVATHSPQIIDGNLHLMVPLEGSTLDD